MPFGPARVLIPAGRLLAAGLLVLLVAVGAGCSGRGDKGGSGTAGDADALRGVTYSNPKPKPEFVLTDVHGRPFDFRRDTAGTLTFLFFGYTSCPDVCPIHMANLAAVLRNLPTAQSSRVRVVFVTTDPERDTPGRLAAWLGNFDRSFIGLTGTPAELAAAQQAAGVAPAVAEAPTAGDTTYAVGHAAQVLAYTPDGLGRAAYPFGTSQADWAHDIPRLLSFKGPP